MLAAFVVMFLKNVFMNFFAPILDRVAAKNGQKQIVLLHYGTWIFYYVIIASISFLGVLLGSKPVEELVNNIPQNVMNGLSAAGGLLPAVGFAMLMKMLWDNKLAVFYLLGFILTAYLKLPAVAVAAIGLVICVVTAQRDLELMNLPQTTATNKRKLTKQEEEEDFFS